MSSVVLRVQELPFPAPRMTVEVRRDQLLADLLAAVRTEYGLEAGEGATLSLFLSGLAFDSTTQIEEPEAGSLSDAEVFPGATWSLIHELAVTREFQILLTEVRPSAVVDGYRVLDRGGRWPIDDGVDFELPADLAARLESLCGRTEEGLLLDENGSNFDTVYAALRDALKAIPEPAAFRALQPELRALLSEGVGELADVLEKRNDWGPLCEIVLLHHRAVVKGPAIALTPELLRRLLPEAQSFSRYHAALESHSSRLPEWPRNPSELFVSIEAALSACPTPESFAWLSNLLDIDGRRWLRLSAVFLAAHPEPDRVDALMPRVVEYTDDLGIWLDYAFGHAHGGRMTRARAAVDQVLRQEPAVPREVRRKLPIVLAALRDHAAAETRLKAFLAEPSLDSVSRSVATMELARILREVGRGAEADGLLRAEQAREVEERRREGGTIRRGEGEKKIGRNDPCPCGSGRKAKKCHGVEERA